MPRLDPDVLFPRKVPALTLQEEVRANKINDAAREFAARILANTPPGADQTAAIRKIREAVWTALNALPEPRRENEPPIVLSYFPTGG